MYVCMSEGWQQAPPLPCSHSSIRPLHDSSMHTHIDSQKRPRPASRGVGVPSQQRKKVLLAAHTHTEEPTTPTILTRRTCLQRTATIRTGRATSRDMSGCVGTALRLSVSLCKVLSERPKPWTGLLPVKSGQAFHPSTHGHTHTHTHTHRDRERQTDVKMVEE